MLLVVFGNTIKVEMCRRGNPLYLYNGAFLKNDERSDCKNKCYYFLKHRNEVHRKKLLCKNQKILANSSTSIHNVAIS